MADLANNGSGSGTESDTPPFPDSGTAIAALAQPDQTRPTAVDDRQLALLPAFSNLELLDLTGCPVTGEGLATILDFKSDNRTGQVFSCFFHEARLILPGFESTHADPTPLARWQGKFHFFLQSKFGPGAISEMSQYFRER